MPIYKRKGSKNWYIDIHRQGRRILKSSGTSDKQAAQQLCDELQAKLWRQEKLGEKPVYAWKDAVIRWLREESSKRSLRDDKSYLRWLDPYLNRYILNEITKHTIEEIARNKENQGAKPATVNRLLAFLRALLRRAEKEWEWIDRAPVIKMRKVQNARIRWITQEEATQLLKELPAHLAAMAAFTLACGLRMSNVTRLRWKNINLASNNAWIHADESKSKRAISVPLNRNAMQILNNQMGQHTEFVFTYKGQPVKDCNTAAWKQALKRAGIPDFRWHDLRHTWATWHIQNGTSLQELQALGGWHSFDMVLRYAHLSASHLKEASNRIEWQLKNIKNI